MCTFWTSCRYPGKFLKTSFVSPRKPWNLVLESPGKSWKTVFYCLSEPHFGLIWLQLLLQLFYGPLDFVHHYLGEPVPEKNQSGFTGAKDSEWQWHQLSQMQICTLPQREPCQHPTAEFFTGQMPFLPPNQHRQSTKGTFGLIWASIYFMPGGTEQP